MPIKSQCHVHKSPSRKIEYMSLGIRLFHFSYGTFLVIELSS